MRDVAKAAGVGVMTVSRVINGDPRVRSGTAARVNDAIRTLGYRRNDLASQLRRGAQSTATVGLLVDDIANPFYATLAGAVEDEARRRGFIVLFGSSKEDPGRERELLGAFCSRRIEGLVAVPAAEDTAPWLAIRAAGTPTVFVDRPARDLDVDAVLIDGRAAARQAVGHLLSHGHRRIGYLGDTATIWTASERLRGYAEALAATGLRTDPALISQGLRSMYAAEAAAMALLSQPDPATALFTANDVITLGALRALRRHGQPVALVGLDDFVLADELTPAVTVVAQDPQAMGETAAQLLFSRVAGDDSPRREVLLPTRLVVRGSGEIRPPT
jgi:LacI family transcriptional regulator